MAGGEPMRLLIAGLALGLMMATAQAQLASPQQNQMNANQRLGSHIEHAGEAKLNSQQAKANDKAYNAALHNLPDKQYDPWHGVR